MPFDPFGPIPEAAVAAGVRSVTIATNFYLSCIVNAVRIHILCMLTKDLLNYFVLGTSNTVIRVTYEYSTRETYD